MAKDQLLRQTSNYFSELERLGKVAKIQQYDKRGNLDVIIDQMRMSEVHLI